MAESQLSIRIKNGPSKFDLMVALFHSPVNGEKDHSVTFVLNSGRELKVNICGAVMMDNSRESWLFHGYDVMRNKYLKIHFDTRTRIGKCTYPEPTVPTYRYDYFSSLPPSSQTLNKSISSDKILDKTYLEKIQLEPIINKNTPLKFPQS